MSQKAFLQAIRDAPEDDTPRLIYADWLHDNGEPERAEFIRVQCRLAKMEEDDPERPDLLRREYELLADHWGEWAALLVGKVRRWQFRRGFVAQVKLEAEQFQKEAKGLFDFAPIEVLDVQHPSLDEVRALLRSRHLRRITRLDLDHARLGDAGVALVADCPNLSNLRHLSLRFNNLGRAGLRALGASAHLTSLRSFTLAELHSKDLDGRAFEAFVASCRLPALDKLGWRGELGSAGVKALVASPVAAQLASLHFREADIGTEGLRLLASSSSFPQLRELSIESDEGISSSSLGDLARSPLLRQLASLELSCVSLNDEGATELARAAEPGALRHLDLSFNKIGLPGARSLARSPLGAALTRLNLSGNPLGNQGLKAIAKSAHLGNLRRLEVYKCAITSTGAKSLLASPYLDQLSYLRLENNAIGRKAFDELRLRLGERLDHEHWDDGLDPVEVVRRVKAMPPRCLRGFVARTETDLLRRFPRDRLDQREYPSVAFEIGHPDPAQKAVLLGYEDTRGYDIFFSPYAIRWEPSGEQHEFFDAEQHGRSAEQDGNCTIVGTGKRKPWKCGKRGCHNHTFIVTFYYRMEYPPERYPHRYLPFADQFYHIDLDAYCAEQDKVIALADFECK